MTIEEIKSKVASQEYDFLRTNPHLGKNIILLGLGGSHAYGTNTETSDLDVRGCALNNKSEILTNENFEQFTNDETDTTVYSFNKLISLLSNVNPNTVEILGLKPEHYLYLSPIGQELLDNKKIFLSKRAVHAFGGYANSQLRRLDNKAARLVGQAQMEQHILNSINNASYEFKNKYFPLSEKDSISLYIDKAVNEDFDKEIFMDVNLTHYPLRDYKSMWSEMCTIVREYAKVGKRNSRAIEHDKLSKHMMHLVRLYLMCFDILERKEIVTYREKDHDFLMEIRNGKYLDENRQPTDEFFEIVDGLEKRLEYAKQNTDLPDNPDYKAIKEFTASVNERIVKGEV
jgi:predicted nucleotidyltransferase